MAEQVRITISRTSPADIQQRQVIVSIDEGPKATLVYGDSVSFTVDPGEHVLKANNTLVWKKTPFSVQAGEPVEFVVANRATRFTLGFLSLLGVAPLYMTIERK